MDDIPYTTPEEDPFNVQPLFLQPRRRRSSLLDKWIQEQQKNPNREPAPATRTHAFLAYPGLNRDPSPSRHDVATLDNYDLVNDDDIPHVVPHEKEKVASTPTTGRTKRTSKLLSTPSSFRNFNLPFRSASPAASSHPDASSPRSSRFSFLPRTPRSSTDVDHGSARTSSHQHNRSTSLSTLNLGKSPYLSDIPNVSTSTKWRPSVLGHFGASSTSQGSGPSDTAYTPSRPSISSGDTYTSGTVTTTESDLPMTPSRMNLMNTLRFRSKSSGRTRSSHISNPALSILSSGPASASTSTLAHRAQTTRIPLAQKPGANLANANVDHGDDDVDDDNCEAVVQPAKQHDPTRPHVAYSSGGTLPRVSLASLSSRHRKKKKLVVRGVGPNDARKFEGVKRWCETFGEKWLIPYAGYALKCTSLELEVSNCHGSPATNDDTFTTTACIVPCDDVNVHDPFMPTNLSILVIIWIPESAPSSALCLPPARYDIMPIMPTRHGILTTRPCYPLPRSV
ncbi:hypothetical protein LshimejAT787_0302250 [Lyophyllum shimeji]|uniref:Uncharacterized protein n=1 Tax=Lyophyllum shimeji TaxID=47721 RepID=A0A9P3UK05_LYOSH|nr:hypothetical protein LshimejAT787_0302250 [Lyophyllum shimeji]